MGIVQGLAAQMPGIKDKLKGAGINKRPSEYVGESLKNAFLMSGMVGILSIFLILQNNASPLIAVAIFIVLFPFMFFIMLKRVDVAMERRAREIDRDVLFAGRFLLVKLNSGKPLINAVFDASESYGVAGEYFKEIVEDIKLGTPLEDALDRAYKTTPSKKFKKILFQINNALKIGVDVSDPLEAVLQEISQDQLLEIQRYGKKLNSLIMFYLLLAIIVPSLGITLFSVVASIMSIKIDAAVFGMVLFFLLIVQLIFIGIIHGIRPNLNI